MLATSPIAFVLIARAQAASERSRKVQHECIVCARHILQLEEPTMADSNDLLLDAAGACVQRARSDRVTIVEFFVSCKQDKMST